MKPRMLYAAAMCLLALVLSGCSAGAEVTQAIDSPRPTLPTEYADRTNPLSADAATIEAGKQLYDTNCAACHGGTGLGDGPAAASLNPPPKPLASEMDQLSDGYIYWRISEGGAMAPFHSAMPAWKNALTEEDIWRIVSYLRSLG